MTSTTVLPFAGGELSSFDPADSSAIESLDTIFGSYTWNTSFARCALRITGATSYASSPKWTAASTFWFHASVFPSLTSPVGRTLSFLAAGVEVMKATTETGGGGDIWRFYTLQSSVLTDVGVTATTSSDTLNQIDIKLVAGGSGSFAVYIAGTLAPGFPVTGLDHSDFSGVTQIQLFGQQGSRFPGSVYWSEVICDTTNHIGDHLWTVPLNTNSAINTGWTGNVTDVNEIVLNDSNFAAAASAALVSTYYASGFSMGSANVLAVIVGARAKCGSGGPQNLGLCVRTGATNYFSSTLALDVGYQAFSYPWSNNPSTSAPWTAAASQAIEAGEQSIT
jgi:hypothetical protein